MTHDQLEEQQGEVLDLRSQPLESLRQDLDCAETCENEKDFRENLDSAIGNAQTVLEGLLNLRKSLPR